MEIILQAKENRKELVKALETLTQEKSTYLKAPTYNFVVAGYTVTRDGNIIVPDDADERETDELIASLENMGFTCIMTEKHEDPTIAPEEPESASGPTADDSEEATEVEPEPEAEAENATFPESADTADASNKTTVEQEDEGLTQVTLSFPISFFAKDAIDRMKAIVASKQSLLKKALDTDNLDIQIDDDRICLPWFTDHGLDGEIDAYSKLTFAIARMALTQTRVTATEKENPDEKLAMRLFLIRLKFIGDEYAQARAILMRNFNSAASRKQVEAALNLCMPEVNTSRTTKEESADE